VLEIAPSDMPRTDTPRRAEILGHATRLFAERGYGGASMGDLAERVGVRKASLFHHFASKEVLYTEVLELLVDSVGARIAQAASSEGSFVDRVDALSDAITTVLGEQPYAARIIIREAMDWGPAMRDTLAARIAGVLEVAEAFLRAGADAGELARLDPKQFLISLIGVHFMPFGIGGVVERLVALDPFGPEFIAVRRDAVRAHVHRMLVVDRTPATTSARTP
jgi:AcrR family transcriptional regulator